MPIEFETHEFTYVFPTTIATDDKGAVALDWKGRGGAFGQRLPLEVNRTISTLQCHRGAFSPEECRAIVQMGEALPHVEAVVETGVSRARAGHISAIVPTPQNHWLFHKLALLFDKVNRDYEFELIGFVEGLQYAMYGPEHHFAWHVDVGAVATSARKVSMTVQLSEPHEYTGGDLEFVGAATGPEARELGAATFFPAYLGHRVSPVVTGLRRSLVAWAYGPAFR